jgi:hypothetical protein
MMRWFAFFSIGAGLVVAACGDNMPPIIGDNDASSTKDVVIAPCSTPASTCPCSEAGVTEVCGTEFHYSGSYVTCSKQYITCQDNGTWGPCVGALVFGAE